jgi:hypothetical protein
MSVSLWGEAPSESSSMNRCVLLAAAVAFALAWSARHPYHVASLVYGHAADQPTSGV